MTKSHLRKNIKPSISLFVTTLIALLLEVGCGYTWIQTDKAKRNYQSAITEYKQLLNKRNSLKPRVSEITSSKFDLQSKQKRLTKTYMVLVKALFGGSKTIKDIIEAKEIYKRYFGADKFRELKRISISNAKMIATANTGTYITFRDFDLKHKTVKIVIYTTFNIDKSIIAGRYGLAYITTNYSFETNKAGKTTIQSAFPTDN